MGISSLHRLLQDGVTTRARIQEQPLLDHIDLIGIENPTLQKRYWNQQPRDDCRKVMIVVFRNWLLGNRKVLLKRMSSHNVKIVSRQLHWLNSFRLLTAVVALAVVVVVQQMTLHQPLQIRLLLVLESYPV
jgi:hypothetical protein